MTKKTLLKRIWLGALMMSSVFIAGRGEAQVSSYTFSQPSGTYTPITGGTVLASAGPYTGGNYILDDISFAATIPFTFNFNGTGYTGITVNTNGWISFTASSPSTTNYSAISSTLTSPGFAAAFNRDLDGRFITTATTTSASNTITVTGSAGMSVGDSITGTGIPAGTTVTAISGTTVTMSASATATGSPTLTDFGGSITTTTTGTSPNRVFVIQWKNFSTYGSSNNAYNFQIQLAEGGGVASNQTISFVYGSYTSASSSAAQVGLRGATNADFIDRTSTTSWSATTAGAANSATVSYSSTILPSSGLTFVYTPPVPCSGAPSSGVAASSTPSACTSTPFTLSTAGATSLSGISFQWQSSPAGLNTFTNIAGATTNPYIIANQTVATDYRVVVTCAASTLSTTSNTVSVGQNLPLNCYCTPIYSTGCTFGDNIDTFTLVGDLATSFVDNATGCTAGGYNNRTSLTPVILSRGTTYSGKISSTYGSSESAKIWIDFNDNGVFESADSVGIVANVPSATTPYSITIPSGTYAAVGNHRMRIRLVYFTTVGSIDPCSNYTYGETHDYIVSITCQTAANPVVNLGRDTTICPGSTITLNAGNAGSTYLYSNAATSQTTNITTGGTYIVRVINPAGCIGRDTIVIAQGVNPVVNLGNDTLICPGSAITLDAGNVGSTYLYSNAATAQTTGVTTGGTYSVVVTNAGKCVGRDTIVIAQGVNPVVNLGNDTAICPGATITLNAGNPGSTYLYSNSATTQTMAVTAGGTYSVIVTNAQKCVGRDTIVITQGVNPVVNLGNDTAICPGVGTTITLNAGNPGSSYLYSNSATTQTIAVTTAGTYSVRVTDANKCVGRDTIVVINGATPIVNLGNDTTVCPGTTITLNAGNIGSTYLYSNSATTRTTGITSGGTYSVVVTNAQGCQGRDTIVIAQGVSPVVNLGNDTTFCPGASITLNAGNTGSTFFYNTGATTQSITVSVGGTYTVRVTNAQKCIGRDTVVIFAGVNPNVNLGNDTAVCPGQTVTLNAGNAGSTYLYSTGATTQTLAVIAGGTYSVRVTNATKCVGRDTIVIAQGTNPVVNLGNDTSTCLGVAITLNAGNAGSTYLYNTGATTQTLSVIPAGNYSVIVTNGQKCVGRDTINVSIIPAASVNNITPVKTGSSVAFTSDAQNAIGYGWSFGDGSTDNVASPTHNYTRDGNYRVAVIVINQCGLDTAITTVAITGLGAGSLSLSDKELNIYPNPATASITLDNKSALKMQSLTVLNTLGQVVLAKNGIAPAKEVLDISMLPAGTYMVRIQTDGGSFLRRVQVIN